MEKRGKKMPYEVVIQERKRVDLYGNVVYYIHWFDKYGYNITNEWKFWSKDIFVKEWSTTGYSQEDYVKGIAFCTKERYTKMVSNNTSDWKTQIDKLIDDEVKSIGMWMWGDVKGYVLEKKVKFVKKYEDESREDEEGEEWEEVDSCWGYYMETDELIEEIMKEHNLKE